MIQIIVNFGSLA